MRWQHYTRSIFFRSFGKRLDETGYFLAENNLHTKGNHSLKFCALKSAIISEEMGNKQTHRPTDIL